MKRATREAIQRQYKKKVLDVCQQWKPGLIARAKAKHSNKKFKEK